MGLKDLILKSIYSFMLSDAIKPLRLFVIKNINNKFLGLDIYGWLSVVVWILLFLLITIITFYLHKLVSYIVKISLSKFIKRVFKGSYDLIEKRKITGIIAFYTTVLFLYFVIPSLYNKNNSNSSIILDYANRILFSSFIFLTTFLINGVLDIFTDLYVEIKFLKKPSIKNYIQFIKILILIISIILVISVLSKKNMTILIGSLGAATAAFTLIFKESILGMVASFQLTVSDMINIGDWIVVPKHHADGEIIDLSLQTIKVLNWDKTISHIPTQSLILDGFQNYKEIYRVNARRIKRAIKIDIYSVKLLNRFEILDILARISRQFPDQNLKKEINSELEKKNYDKTTNLYLFVKFMNIYLKNSPLIKGDMTTMVRTLDPGPDGIPVEFYAFSNTSDWEEYEDIRTNITSYFFSILQDFKLKAYQK